MPFISFLSVIVYHWVSIISIHYSVRCVSVLNEHWVWETTDLRVKTSSNNGDHLIDVVDQRWSHLGNYSKKARTHDNSHFDDLTTIGCSMIWRSFIRPIKAHAIDNRASAFGCITSALVHVQVVLTSLGKVRSDPSHTMGRMQGTISTSINSSDGDEHEVNNDMMI